MLSSVQDKKVIFFSHEVEKDSSQPNDKWIALQQSYLVALGDAPSADLLQSFQAKGVW